MSKYTGKQEEGLSWTWKIVLALIFVGNVYMLESLSSSRERFTPAPTPPTSVEYAPVHLPNNIELLWMKTPLFTPFDQYYGSIHLVIEDKTAFLLGSLEDNGINKPLMYIDLLSGEVKWERNLPNSYSSHSHPHTIGSNSRFIYAGFNGTQKISGDIRWGAGRVQAYDIQSGKMVWSQVIGGAGSIQTMIVTEDAVSVRGSGSSHSYLFDAETGNILDTREANKDAFVWFVENGISYEESRTSSFQAVDTQTGNIIWQSEKRYVIEQPPLLTNNIIIARLGDAQIRSAILALDSKTGELLWSHNNTLGNVAIGGSIVYFLTTDIEVKAVDIKTGEILTTINFSPNTLSNISNFHKFYLAANNDNDLLVYFGVSQQLFAFHFVITDKLSRNNHPKSTYIQT